MEFENACSEMYYILEHMNPKDKEKIPEYIIHFFRDNRSLFYKVNLDVTKELSEQDITDETKAFIHILNEEYCLASEENQDIIEENYLENEKDKKSEENEEMSLVTIKKENIILKWIKRLLKKLQLQK